MTAVLTVLALQTAVEVRLVDGDGRLLVSIKASTQMAWVIIGLCVSPTP